MRSSLRLVFLIISLSAFAVSLKQLAGHWEYEDAPADTHHLMTTTVNAQTLHKEITEAIDDGRFEQARMYIDIGKQHGYGLYYEQYQQQLIEEDTQERRIKDNVGNFMGGFVSGKGSSGAGVAGAIAADFTVVGDMRDLHTEYMHYQKEEPVDELVATLSGVGIGLTALAIGTAGSAAPAKAGVSMVKMAKKTRQLTPAFQKQLLGMAGNVFDWKGFVKATQSGKGMTNVMRAAKTAYHPKAVKPLGKMAGQVSQIQKSSSVADTLHMMKYVESTKDLRHLTKVTTKHGKNTRGYLLLLGKGVLRGGKILKKTTAFFIGLLGSLVSFIFSLIFLFPAKKKRKKKMPNTPSSSPV
ncbi:MAG: hypothetical protein KAG20_05945 [Cocleimonas sp.]|nr:hypothetical protein [Cocleimonas sp.]